MKICASFIVFRILIYSRVVKSDVFERSIKYPLQFYNEVSPCPCDLTENRCDTYCCCDQDCDSDYHGNWTCLPGLHGGFDPGTFVTNNCSYEPQLFDTDWNSILCLVKSRSSYLGLYYEEQTEIDPQLKPATTSPLGSFAKSISEGQIQRKIYKHGRPVRVVYNESEGIYGHLNLPAKLGSGCSWSPVQYLVDSTAKCSKIVTPDKCSKNSLLDYQMYLMPLPRGMDVGNIPKVLKIPYKNDVIELEVNYFYALEPENYISNHGKRKTMKLPNDIISQIDSIDDILANLDKSEAFQNGFRGSSDGKCVKMEQFPKDDFHQEDQVHLENGFKCINAVLEVNYKFFWRGNEITKMNANILLGNLTLILEKQMETTGRKAKVLSSTQFQELHLIFSVDYQYDTNKPDLVKKSGNPGYNIGEPIRGFHNETKEESAPKIWYSHDASSLCRTSSLRWISFLEDTQSGCFLQLSRKNFTDCEQLRNEISRIQAELIEMELLIAKGGSDVDRNYTTYSNDFSEENERDDMRQTVPILFEDFSSRIKEEKNGTRNMHQECQVPSHLHVEVMYSNTTTGIYRISGFKINYFPEKWSWICLHQHNSCETKKFQLKSSVQFIQVPVVWHFQNTSKFSYDCFRCTSNSWCRSKVVLYSANFQTCNPLSRKQAFAR